MLQQFVQAFTRPDLWAIKPIAYTLIHGGLIFWRPE